MIRATTDEPGKLVNRLISQRLQAEELDQVNDLIANGTDVYLAHFYFDHASHAPLIARVSPWTEDAKEITVTFAEKILHNKRIAMDETVTIYYLQPFNPA